MVGGPALRVAALLFACLLLLLVGSGAAMAQEESEADLQARYDQLFQQMLVDPGNLDLLFEFAGVAVQLGNYESAISSYERMLLLRPDLPRVKLELGALYFRLGSYEAARRYFEEVKADPDLPPEAAERVDLFLARIDEETADTFWTGFLTVAGRYQTNANAGPENIIVRAAGTDAEISDEFRPEDDFSFVVLGAARNLVRIDLGADAEGLPFDNQVFWQTDLEAYYSAEVQFQNLNVGLIGVETGPQLEFVPADPEMAPLYLRPYFLADFASLGQKPFYWTVGGGLSLATTFSDTVGVQLFTEVRYRDFNNTDENPDLDELTGVEFIVGADSNILITDELRARAGIFYDHDDARVNFQSNQEIGFYAGLDLLYDAPLLQAQEPWEASLTATGIFTGYREPDPSVDPGVTRRDTEYRINFVNTVPVYEDIALVGQVEWLQNLSNLPNFRFNNLTFLVGTTMEF